MLNQKCLIGGIFFLLFFGRGMASSQELSNRILPDSTVTEFSDGSRDAKYIIKRFDFGPISHPSAANHMPLSITEEAKEAYIDARHSKHEPSVSGRLKAPLRGASVNLADYSVGEIAMQDGTTPTGARTYHVPIMTASGFKLTPSIAIGYNSQAAEGWLGYGWDIQGLSSITLISKNKYYHGISKGANTQNTDAVFALDGNPLVTNTQSETQASFPLITATGHVLVSPVYDTQGYVISFTVKYPNGLTALYGVGSNSASNKPSYPITEMTDLEGKKITFQYYTESTNGNNRIKSIRYGYDSSNQYKAEIIFSYTTNSSYVTRYYSGKSVYRHYRLNNITSKSDGVVLCQYSFTYEQKDNVWLLSQIDCTSEGESLRPLQFEYGVVESNSSANSLIKKDSLILSNAYTSPDADFIYRRGKFVSSSFNDGVLIYPYFDNYGVTYSRKPFLGSWRFQFGSLYPADQVILFAPSLSDYNDVDDSIITGSGFQTIEAVDVDGDGLDELVKVNFNGVSGSNTKLLITVYECNSQGRPEQKTQFQVQVQGTVTSGEYVSPYRREYYWGDFCGNGKIQLLTVAYDKNYNSRQNYDQTSYAALIDISAHTKLCDAKLFDFPITNHGCLLTYDLDNDSQTELCYATASGFDVYRYGTGGFNKERTLPSPTSSALSNPFRPCYVTDLNGDGYIDIMSAPNVGSTTAWDRYAYNGNVFEQSTVTLSSRTGDEVFMFIDVTQDGLSDLVKISGTTLGTYINKSGSVFGSYTQSPSSISNSKGIVPCNTVDYTGMSSFIKLDGFFAYEYQYASLSPRLRHLTKSVDSMGRVLMNSYEYLPSSSRYWTDNSVSVNNSAGYSFRTLPIYVLDGEDAYLSEDVYSDRYRNKYYSYYNGVVHSLGLGFCGFSKIRSYDYSTGTTEIVEEVHDTQKLGVVTSVSIRHGSVWDEPFHSVVNTYDNNSTTYGKLNPRLKKSVEHDGLTGVETTTSYTYGIYNLPTQILTSRRIGTGIPQTEQIIRKYDNSVSASKYALGIVKEESVIKDLDGIIDLSWKEKTENTYDEYCRPLTRKHFVGYFGVTFNHQITPPSDSLIFRRPIDTTTVHPFVPLDDFIEYDATNLVNETHWQYDNYGNVISEKTSQYGGSEFVGNTYTYDSNGRYLSQNTDALGHTTTYSGYNKFGKPASAIDYRGRTTTYTYDSWGNLIATTYPDGAVEQITVTWGGAGLYTVKTAVTGKPLTNIHYDALGREIRSGVKRFNGQWQWVDKKYDIKGRLSRTSLPYRSNAASHWNVYSYDNYGRQTSLIEASGRSSTWAYNGTSVTTVKDGITSTSTTDAFGNVISVADDGGTISYTLRDDGQPSMITAPGNVTTTFTYDDYGRRTKIVDPSAGTQTDTYVWNIDGSSEFTHTNPNGTVKTYKDKYGRTTLVERPGEYNTVYTYDTYGRLVGKQSTNGTSMEYTYDDLDRIASEREIAPDEKWLGKIYYYGTGSILNYIQYLSQSGPITPEFYSYSNGHNTGISIPNNTVVSQLIAENDLGMPQAIESGSILREYGYTAFGMPTFRKMNGGDLQDFTYNFDVSTGNLLSRTDGIHSQTETFGYDTLNRLIAIGSRSVSYDNKGNILSIGGVGSMTYGSTSHPYQLTSLMPEEEGLVPDRQQIISYTCYNRPSIITEGGRSATFTYNCDGERVKMYVADGDTPVLSRYYIGDRYEYDETPTGNVERLYLGGDAYSAPMVYQRENGGSWTAYNIGRDYLGNITHIATVDGTAIAEYSYDPWGRLRNPETLEIYSAGSEPELFLGRGFTGHEHLSWFGLVNMNARLYDPLLGRFLSPDPYVQAPDFTQNFNRYSYALNNPLRYTDENGEWVHIVIGAVLGSIGNLIANWNNCEGFWEYFTSFTVGAAAGAAVAATGGAAAAAGGGFWATAGVIGVGTASGAVTGATGDIISQTGENFSGIDNLNWESVGISAAAGGISGAVSSGVGIAMSGVHVPVTINGKTFESPLLTSWLAGAATGAAGHVTGGTVAGLLSGESFDSAFGNSFGGIESSILIGGAFSAASTTAYDLSKGINPFARNNDLSDHARVRIKERGISLNDLEDAIKNPMKITPIKYDNLGRPSVTYIGAKATVVVNPITGKIITAYPTHTKTVIKLKNPK